MKNIDLFGNEIETNLLLRDKFIEPPFSILDTKSGSWQKRKNLWKKIGIKSEVGRDVSVINMDTISKENNSVEYTSIFDPALCEVLYHWFCKPNGNIFDPFAGGSVRGIVANYLGYKYTGIDIREEQIISNRKQAENILPFNNRPNWYIGDTNELLNDEWNEEYDLMFSCPPYADLEVYSELDGDISNMPYHKFIKVYSEIISKSYKLIKKGGFAIFVVGEVRDENGDYYGFVPDTINAFKNAGFKYYNEAILLNAIASASMRANGNMKSAKLVKVHQNILIFKK